MKRSIASSMATLSSPFVKRSSSLAYGALVWLLCIFPLNGFSLKVRQQQQQQHGVHRVPQLIRSSIPKGRSAWDPDCRNERSVGSFSTALSFFRRKSNDNNEDDESEVALSNVEADGTTNSKLPSGSDNDEKTSSKGSLFGFLNRNDKDKLASTDTTPTGTRSTTVTTTTATVQQQSLPKPLSPVEEAARLRAEADRARLEAERMDAELTLRKIERLEKELASATASASKNDNSNSNNQQQKGRKSSDDLQREMDSLLRKVRSSSISSSDSKSSSSNTSMMSTTAEASSTSLSTTVSSSSSSSAAIKPTWPEFIQPYDEKEYNDCYKKLKEMPTFMQGTMALMVESNVTTDSETGRTVVVNLTDLATRMYQMRRFDLSYSSKPPPTFTPQEIAKAETIVRKLATDMNETKGGGANWWGGGGADTSSPLSANSLFGITVVDAQFPEQSSDESSTEAFAEILMKEDRLDQLWKMDPKAMARLVLEYEYYLESDTDDDDSILRMAAEEPWLQPFLNEFNFTLVDGTIDKLFPRCTTKRDAKEGTSQIPTEAQVQQLIADILPKVNFRSSSKPEAVLGGFIIRGSTSLGGDEFISKLDSAMERSSLKDKMTVLYTEDFSLFADMQSADSSPFQSDDEQPILYIVSPNICRDSKPLQLSIISAFGLATSWYMSVYPFLLNPTIASRVDEQLAIADANMVPDLAFLTDLSVPLFATFIGIQLIHELGHLVVAGANGIQTTSPTFVPSILTGVTSTVTTFKSPPKNKASMFDFSVAGPVAGMLASLLAIAVGVQLTTISDPSLFPALPLEILRQSTLGGGIIEMGLGNGALSVPVGALGTSAVAGMTVPLHPIAIAGYISLIVNALAILPIGSKFLFLKCVFFQ